MTGVPQSSSHADFRAVQQDAQPRSFEVGSEAELLGLLNFIRRGPFLPDQKNMLRDVVLDFALTKEVDVLNIVAKALARNGATLTNNGTPLIEVAKTEPAAPQVSTEGEGKAEQKEAPAETESKESAPAAPSGFGGARPQPSFGQTAPTPVPAAPPVPAPNQAEETTHKTVSVTSADLEPAPSVADRTGVQDTPPESTTDPVSKVPEPTPTPAVEEKSVAETNSETPKQEVSKPEEVTPPAEPAPVASTDPQTRIKEIKMAINEKVGNPVNLIDSNNQVGREYMNALLNAMKSANGGQREEVALAMQRLEKAFAAVQESLSSGEIVIPKKEEQAQKEKQSDTRWEASSVPDVPPATPATPAAPPPVAPTPDPVPQPEPAVPPTAPEPAVREASQTPQNKNVQPQMVMVDDVPADLPSAPTPSAPVTPTSSAVPVPPTPAPTPAAPSQPATPVPTPVPQAPQTPPAPQATPASVPTPPQSLAAKVQAEQAEREAVTQKNVAAIQAEKAATLNDPLHADQVNKGLEQLLSEWKLFKSSGIFGTGPNGYDHPLYKAIAPLPMAAVIAGRFDGVNPEIRQSISDYMSGWRYEQGVVHEMNESFEHYLRRVIHKILEKQSTGR